MQLMMILTNAARVVHRANHVDCVSSSSRGGRRITSTTRAGIAQFGLVFIVVMMVVLIGRVGWIGTVMVWRWISSITVLLLIRGEERISVNGQ